MITGTIVVAAAYLVGGIPFGYLFYRLSHGRDIRDVGSGNIGATNMVRAAGWGLGLVTLLFDVAKGAGAAWAGLLATGSQAWAAAAGVAAVAGHCLSIWLRFRGGKGVATGFGAFLVLDPVAMLVALVAFALTLGFTRVIAAGSVIASFMFPVAAGALGAGLSTTLWFAAACLLIILRHHQNLRRMFRGQEPRMFGGDGGEGEEAN